jgi:hypothetical protein
MSAELKATEVGQQGEVVNGVQEKFILDLSNRLFKRRPGKAIKNVVIGFTLKEDDAEIFVRGFYSYILACKARGAKPSKTEFGKMCISYACEKLFRAKQVKLKDAVQLYLDENVEESGPKGEHHAE